MVRISRYHETFEDAFVRQTEWVEGRGLLLVVAMYLGNVGSASYLLGLFLATPAALVFGWILAVVGKGMFHMLFLGRPERFWRAAIRPHRSWLSRGFWAVTIFAPVGAVYALSSLHWTFPWFSSPISVAGFDALFWVTAGLAAFLLVYDGFLIRAGIGIPFWRRGLMPVLLPTFGFLAGTGVLSILNAVVGMPVDAVARLEAVDRVALVLAALILTTALIVAPRASEAAKASVFQLIRGYARWSFYGGVVVLAVLLPIIMVTLSLTVDVPVTIIGITALLSVIGEFFFMYTVLKSGIYQPLYPHEVAEEVLSLSGG